MEEFLSLLSTDIIVFIFKNYIKRMHREVVFVCVSSCFDTGTAVFILITFRKLEVFHFLKIPFNIKLSSTPSPQNGSLASG